MKLTQAGLARLSLPKDTADKVFFDDELPRFGVRIRAGGSRKFVVHYQHNGGQRRHTIGTVASMSLDDARKKARKLLVAVDEGKDPAAEKAVTRADAALVFSAVLPDYLATCQARMKPRSYDDAQRYLNQHWKPLHKIAVASVSRNHVATQLRAIAKENGPVAADRARSALSSFFGWLVGEGMCDGNPVVGTNKTGAGAARERVLSDAELVAIWNAAPDTAFGRIVRLLMLTGQRRDEIGALRWNEAATESTSPLIALPGERTKNGRPHDVPLSAPALDVLSGQPRIVGHDLVFGEGKGGFAGWSRAKIALDKASKVKGWTLHDLRRTAATRMADLGVLPHVVEAVLNHISGHKSGVAGIYNRATYAAEKRAALDLWGNHVLTILAQASGANVTKLRRG